MRLADLGYLALLAVIPLLHRWWKERNRPARVTYSLPIPRAVAGWDPQGLLRWLRYAALALFIAALARPQTSFRQTERKVSGIDIMMVMDVSASMNIEDLAERPRLDVAKDVMERFIRGRESDRIGFLVFSGEPLTLAPPTLDYGIVLKAVRDAETGVLKDGTGIGDGLALAVNRLRNSTARSRVIILLTDGDNNVGQVDPATAGELAAGYGIRVYTIAIGTEGRVKLPIRRRGILGDVVTTYQWFDNALNPELLQLIAKQTEGKFYRVQDIETLDAVFAEINRLEKSEIASTERVRYDEAFARVLQLAILLLALERVLGLAWWRGIA
jgi:Ca-activated chloride channel family protein